MNRFFAILPAVFFFLLPCVCAQGAGTILRVLVGKDLGELKIILPDGGSIQDIRSRKVRDLRPGEQFSWTLVGDSGSAKGGKSRRQTPNLTGQELSFKSRKPRVTVNGLGYRGEILAKFSKTGVTLLNRLSLDDYVRGVVGSEIGSLSPVETLKAQSVIVRTYAFANLGKHGKEGFDLCNRDHCQVYGGMKSERNTIDRAVDATRGIIMVSGGNPVSSLYHSTCGGMTSDNDSVYGGKPVAYLRRVNCNFCKAGINYRWTRRLPMEFLQRRTAKENIVFQKLLGVKIESPAPMDRVNKLFLLTDRGTFSVKGTLFRKYFDLPSNTFVVGEDSRQDRLIEKKPFAVTESAAASRFGYSILQPGPDQIILQSARGIGRVVRPHGGWHVLACIPYSIGKNFSPPASSSENRTSLDVSPSQEILFKRRGKSISELLLNGRGYGHQVGLCQAGSIELGRRGWSYRQILPFYYRQVALRVLNP